MSEPRATAVLVEDEPQIRRFVREALEQADWQVFEATTVAEGLAACGTRRPDLVVLDLGLPDGDGVDLIRDLRAWSRVPLIVLSARSDEAHKIAALDAGADDYLTKPFGIGELLARVRVAARRKVAAPGASLVRIGDVSIDLATRVVTKGDAVVHLTPIEYRLLTVLLADDGRVLTHRHLLRAVWGPSHVESHHYLRVYMGNLRAKLEDEPARPQHLLTVTGVGYRLVQSD